MVGIFFALVRVFLGFAVAIHAVAGIIGGLSSLSTRKPPISLGRLVVWLFVLGFAIEACYIMLNLD